jgi:hypothetical protein
VVWDSDGSVVTNWHVLATSLAKLGVEKDPGAGGEEWGAGAGKQGAHGAKQPARASGARSA